MPPKLIFVRSGADAGRYISVISNPRARAMDDSPVIYDSFVEDEAMRVRQRMRSGELPAGPVRELFGGHGTGARCNCCDRVISADQIEFEIHAAGTKGSGQRRLMMHSTACGSGMTSGLTEPRRRHPTPPGERKRASVQQAQPAN
jgi:hypothetical protein